MTKTIIILSVLAVCSSTGYLTFADKELLQGLNDCLSKLTAHSIKAKYAAAAGAIVIITSVIITVASIRADLLCPFGNKQGHKEQVIITQDNDNFRDIIIYCPILTNETLTYQIYNIHYDLPPEVLQQYSHYLTSSSYGSPVQVPQCPGRAIIVGSGAPYMNLSQDRQHPLETESKDTWVVKQPRQESTDTLTSKTGAEN